MFDGLIGCEPLVCAIPAYPFGAMELGMDVTEPAYGLVIGIALLIGNELGIGMVPQLDGAIPIAGWPTKGCDAKP